MPIDARIPLAIQTPEFPSPLDSYARVVSLRRLVRDAQMDPLRQRQIEEQTRRLELGNREREQEAKDDQTIRQAFAGWNGEPDTLRRSLRGRISADLFAKIDQGFRQDELNYQNLDEKRRKARQDMRADLANVGNALVAAPAEQHTALWSRETARLRSHYPDLKEQIPVEFPGIDEIKRQIPLLMGSKAYEDRLHAKASEQRAADLHVPALEQARAGAVAKTKEAAAADLANAPSQTDYQRIWGALPARVSRHFPLPEDWTTDTPGQVRRIARKSVV